MRSHACTFVMLILCIAALALLTRTAHGYGMALWPFIVVAIFAAFRKVPLPRRFAYWSTGAETYA